MKNKLKSQKKIAIIGAGMGGISASIHLASRGFDVTIFEKNNSLGGRCNVIEEEGFKFDLGPSLLNYPWVFKELFKAAGENFENHIELLEVKSGVKFLWDNGEHFNISGDYADLNHEIQRLEGTNNRNLQKFLNKNKSRYDIAFKKFPFSFLPIEYSVLASAPLIFLTFKVLYSSFVNSNTFTFSA